MKNIITSIVILFTSILFGQTNWTMVNSNTTNNLRDITFTSTNIGYIVGDNGTVLKSIDGGNNWSSIFSDFTQTFISTSFVNDNVGYILTSENLYKTENGGNNWNLQYSNSLLNTVYFINENVGFIGSEFGIFKTLNGGLTWSTYITNNAIKSISFPSENIGYFVGGTAVSDNIYKTNNQGLSYIETPLIMQSVKEKVFFVDNNIGFVIGWYSPLIKKTIDGGLNWINLTETGDLDINFLNGSFGYRIDNGSHSPIFSTNDGGLTWFMEVDINNNNLTNLTKISTKYNKAFVIGTNGKIYKKSILLSLHQLKKNENNIIIYPNPAVNEFNIATEKIINKVEIVDNFGRLVKTIIPTLNQTSINVSGLSAGVYSVILVCDGVAKDVKSLIIE